MAEDKCKTYSIKMYPAEIERFERLVSEMDDVRANRDGMNNLMDAYEYPKTVKVTDPELVKKNEELQAEVIVLKEKLDAALTAQNDAAMTAQKLQLELESKDSSNTPENRITVDVHPVPWHFLKNMSAYLTEKKKEEVTPGYILTDLFIKDLQNPRSNNLPYIVSSSEIEKVLHEYRKTHPEEYQEK